MFQFGTGRQRPNFGNTASVSPYLPQCLPQDMCPVVHTNERPSCQQQTCIISHGFHSSRTSPASVPSCYLKKMNFLNGQTQYERPKHTLTSKGFSPVNVQKLRAPVSQVTQCCGRASVHSCCCNNTPRAEWPAKSSIYCPCFWRLGVSDQSTSVVGRGPSSRWQTSQGRRGEEAPWRLLQTHAPHS